MDAASFPPGATLTPHSLLHVPAVSAVKRFWGGGLLHHLGVPTSIWVYSLSRPYLSEDNKKMAGLQYYLQTVPGASWGRIAGVLWFLEEHAALKIVRQYLRYKHGTL